MNPLHAPDVAFTSEDGSSPVNIQTPTRVPRFGVFAFRGSYAHPLRRPLSQNDINICGVFLLQTSIINNSL